VVAFSRHEDIRRESGYVIGVFGRKVLQTVPSMRQNKPDWVTAFD
jgi:hypothetical protein